MYTAYFGFREKPFAVTPNPRFFYTNPVYAEAYATLQYAVRSRLGFALLTGEAGTGKTTLLRKLMDSLEATVSFVFFYNTNLTFDEILTFSCQELGLDADGKGRVEKIQVLNEFLLARLAKGSTVALLIDEAQNLSPQALEDLRLLSNLETEREKLLQIVLVGQPELDKILDQPRLRQLKQRISCQRRLDRLKEREIGPFIQARLLAVGYERQDLFSAAAIQKIAVYSRGIPRLVNVICDNALLIAYATSRKAVSADMIGEVARDLRLVHDLQATIGDAAGAALESDPYSARDFAPSREERFPGQLSESSAARWATSLLLLLVGGALSLGIAALYFGHSSDLLSTVTRSGGELLRSVERTTGLGGGAPVPTDASKDADRPAKPASSQVASAEEPAGGVGSPAALAEPSPGAVSTDIRPPSPAEPSPAAADYRLAARDALAEPPAARPATPERAHTEKERPVGVLPRSPLVPPVAARGDEVAVSRGASIYAIVESAYGRDKVLGMDLVKEFNELEDVDRIPPGRKLTLPPLVPETLVHRQPDGSYRLILASFPRFAEANQLAQTIASRGFRTAIQPRKVSASSVLYRVEVQGLKSPEEAAEIWRDKRIGGG